MLQHQEEQQRALETGVLTQLDMPLGYGDVERDAAEAKSKPV